MVDQEIRPIRSPLLVVQAERMHERVCTGTEDVLEVNGEIR